VAEYSAGVDFINGRFRYCKHVSIVCKVADDVASDMLDDDRATLPIKHHVVRHDTDSDTALATRRVVAAPYFAVVYAAVIVPFDGRRSDANDTAARAAPFTRKQARDNTLCRGQIRQLTKPRNIDIFIHDLM